jgi:N-acetylglucosaminyl-diphospho-decaprenol L-rhamnosyltransferase
MDLSIIIVNWNSKDYLRKCIASILAETRNIEFEIIVIDGASFDGTDKMLRQHYPQVRFIQSSQNIGFAKANNEAFKFSRGNTILFLNPDTEIKGKAVQVLLRESQSLPDAGVVGAKLLNTDGTIQTSCIRSFPTILNETLDFEPLRQRFLHSRLWGMGPLFDKSKEMIAVDAISGACMMVRRSVFEKVGMFSTHYFMYSEDIDLCYKTAKLGFRNYYVPSAIVTHHGGGSSGQNEVSTFSSVMIVESQWRFFVSNRSLGYGWLYRVSIMAASAVRVVAATLLWHRSAVSARKKTWKTAVQKWLVRLRWALGLENWAKNC